MNIFEVILMPVCLRIKSNVSDIKAIKVCDQENGEILKFHGDFINIIDDSRELDSKSV